MKAHVINKSNSNLSMLGALAAPTFKDPVCGMNVAPDSSAGQCEYAYLAGVARSVAAAKSGEKKIRASAGR